MCTETQISCYKCGEDLTEDELEAPYQDNDGNDWCDQCYKEEFLDTCGICQEDFERTKTPEQTRIVIAKEYAKEQGLVPGIYQVLEFPFYYAFGMSSSATIEHDKVQLLRELDINSMCKKLYNTKTQTVEQAEEICPDCYSKYVIRKRTAKRIEYWNLHTDEKDKWATIHKPIYQRGIIENGK